MSESPEQLDHAQFREQIAAALAGGLSAAERSAFDAHAATCEACAAELAANRKAEEQMTMWFATAQPVAGFEDRVIQRLRFAGSRRLPFRLPTIHPAIQKAATGVAVAVVLAGFGYVATQVVNPRDRYSSAVNSNSVQIDGLVADATTQPSRAFRSSMRQEDSISRQKSAAYSYQIPFAGTTAVGSGWKFNYASDGGFAVSGDVKPGAASGNGVVNGTSSVRFGVEPQARAANGGNLYWDTNGRDDYSSKSITSYYAAVGGAPGAKPAPAPVAEAEKSHEMGDKEVPALVAPGQAAAPTNGPVAGKPVSSGSELYKKDVRWFEPTLLGTLAQQKQPVVAGVELKVADDVSQVVKDIDADGAKNLAEGRPPEVVIQREQEQKQFPLLSPPAVAAVPAPAEVKPPEPKPPEPPANPASQRKVIRNGSLEFEVDRFDAAYAQVSKLTTEAGGYVGTTDSEKLPNGKVKGTVTVRVPPDRLDTLVLQLRGIGDLKSQKLEAQDVSKQYSDMESQLKAARAMEERLIAIIKEGKGQIKDLLAAEKELGNWRTKIEQLVGEMKFYDNQVALSTLHIALYERDIKTPATAYETETMDAGVETEDVEKARASALKAIEEAKGRVIQSDMKRYDAGQFGATIVAEVPADTAGPLLDRLKQLGTMARLDVQRKQTAADNAGPAPLRVEKRNTRLNLSLYNLANVAPRQTTTLNIAADDVEAAYKTVIARVTKAGGRIVTSNLSRNKPEATTGTISFEVPTAESDGVATDVRAAGEVMKLSLSENPDVQNVTTAKRGFSLSLMSSASVAPRETATLQIAATDVVAARDKIAQAAKSGGARVLASQLNQNDQQNVNATLELDIRRDALAAVDKAIADSGQTISRVITRSSDTENTLDSRVRVQLTLGPAEKLPPREMTTMSVELSDVEAAMGDLQALAKESGGRAIDSNLSKDREGRSTAHVVVDVPLDKARDVIAHARQLGAVRTIESGKNEQVPVGPLSKARIDITFGNAEAIVSPENGVFATIRRGLSTSFAGLMWSLQLIVIGLCFVLPWALIVVVGWRVIKRRKKLVASAS